LLAYLGEAEVLAAALDDPRRQGRVSLFLSQHCRMMGMHDEATAAAQRALALATASGDSILHGVTHQYLGFNYHVQGDYRRAIDSLRQAVAFFDGARRHEHFGFPNLPAVLSRVFLAMSHAALGTLPKAGPSEKKGRGLLRRLLILVASCWPHGIGLLALRQGDLSRALPVLERAVGICDEADLPVYFPG
jgi:tetratricopeptide (TPR) repeat protein